MTINPIEELTRVVAQSADLDSAIAIFARRIAESGRSTPEIEKTLDVLRRAFRAFAESRGDSPPSTVCGFCKRNQEEVSVLVAASDAAICDECAALAIAVIENRAERTDGSSRLRAVLQFVRGARKR